jgi:Ca-activated chloride channel homolog
MLSFAWPWLLLLLPLPWVARLLLPEYRPQTAALKVPLLEIFEQDSGQRSVTSRSLRWPAVMAMSAWILLVLAAARPQWLGELIEFPVSGRDVMLAVDLSPSMSERDFELRGQFTDRLTATKLVAGDFIERRVGDRVGLILFGEQAYLQTPLTFDRQTVMTLLDEAELGMAGPRTAIGDAIGVAVKHLRGEDSDKRVVILLTDGANNAGELHPITAAEIAARQDIRIFTIAIGSDEVWVHSPFGLRRAHPSAEIDKQTLIRIAELTRGRYFHARDTSELENIYATIDTLEPIEQDPEHYRPRMELYHWPLALALLLAAVLIGLHTRDRLIGYEPA